MNNSDGNDSVYRLEGTSGEQRGGLVIMKKGQSADVDRHEFKRPAPRQSLLGLDKLAASKRQQIAEQDAAKSTQHGRLRLLFSNYKKFCLPVLTFVVLDWILSQIVVMDTSDLRQFGTETLRHCSDGCEVSGQFGTSTKSVQSHFGPKYRTVRSHGPSCPAIWTSVSHPMIRNVLPKFVVYMAFRPSSLFKQQCRLSVYA